MSVYPAPKTVPNVITFPGRPRRIDDSALTPDGAMRPWPCESHAAPVAYVFAITIGVVTAAASLGVLFAVGWREAMTLYGVTAPEVKGLLMTVLAAHR